MSVWPDLSLVQDSSADLVERVWCVTMPSGGISAAYGFNYQYLATAVYVLRRLRDDLSLLARTVLVVEPDSVSATGVADDIVDFAIEVDGEAVERVQVKASRSPDERPLQPAEARDVFTRLCGDDSCSAVLLTNRPLSKGLRGVCTHAGDTAYGSSFRWRPDTGGASGISQQCSASIVVDGRSAGALGQELSQLIREFRRDRALSQGLTSSQLLGAIIRHHIFEAAAGLRPQRIPALELVTLLSMPDSRIAHVAGAFDWGVPITGIPSLPASVPRLQILDDLTSSLGGTTASRAPTIGVLVGHTGTGKSVIAADYCHINAHSYEFICWIDCRDEGLIEARVRDITAQLTNTAVVPGTEIAPLFTGALGRHRGPWLLVFDGAAGCRDIEKYLPTAGNGSILVTSTNSLGWWTSAHTVTVGGFLLPEAIACFADYAGIDESDVPTVAGAISTIVDRLGRIPLAVSMAGMYFRNSASDIHELVPGYFEALDALQDDLAIPPGYDRTAFAAIRYAVDNLGKGTSSPHAQDAKAVLYYGSLLSPELIPLNMIIAVCRLSGHTDLVDMAKPVAAEQVLVRGIVSVLRTQTIAHREMGVDDLGRKTLASDTIVIHPLVHEILRSTYLHTLPAGQLQVVAAALMYFLVPWLGWMRTRGEFFALEQLRVHADALLGVVEEREPLTALTPQNDRVYKHLKALLLMELGACFASTARFDESTKLASRAAQLLLSMPDEKGARALAMKSMADIVADLSYAGVAPEGLAATSERLVPIVEAAENSGHAGIRALAYEQAEQSLQMVRRTRPYREFPPLQQIAAGFESVAARNPERNASVYALMQQVNDLTQQRAFTEILALVPRMRAMDTSVYDRVTFDAIEVVAQLHTGGYDTATRGLDTLLDLQPTGNHLALQLRFALRKIAEALHEVLQRSEPPVALRDYLDRTVGRVRELGWQLRNPSDEE
ncbi:hypothetical protein AB0M22_17510 [Nocardia sp. NPDC051756]|uniref:hypothetical protein n=1 Tax=Nocardia sp. NPDC051756 TaxID=3154751 RepID=UPI003427EB19